MGVLNLTADSFSDGGRFLSPTQAIQHAQAMMEAGGDIQDIGAENNPPGAATIK